MCGGGGGGGGNDWTYQANIDRDVKAQERRDEQARADKTTADAEAEKTATRNKFTTDIAAAPEKGRALYQQYIAERGLPYDAGAESKIVQSIIDQIPDLDPNVNKYFTNEAVGTQLDTVAQGTRDRLGNEIRSTFAPGFERTLIPDTADDPFISSILGEQRANAQKVVDFNKARGLLNETGYGAAQNKLNTQGSAARSTLSQIGESILGKYRQGVSDIRGEAGTAASGYKYGQAAPDIGSYYTRAAGKAKTDLAGIEGSIRGAVGGTNYFDAPMALQAGGTMQGPIDLTTASAVGPMAENTKRDKGRGLGSSGVF
jgi:hypothetical protein